MFGCGLAMPGSLGCPRGSFASHEIYMWISVYSFLLILCCFIHYIVLLKSVFLYISAQIPEISTENLDTSQISRWYREVWSKTVSRFRSESRLWDLQFEVGSSGYPWGVPRTRILTVFSTAQCNISEFQGKSPDLKHLPNKCAISHWLGLA